MSLFLAQPEDFRHIYPRILEEYQSNPEEFATNFFDLLPQIDPKLVRLIGYQLYTHQVDLGQLYKLRPNPEKPKFLFNLADFPFESMIVLLKYGFPKVIDGDLLLTTSLDRVTAGRWFEFYLKLGFNLNLIQRSSGDALLHHFARAGRVPQVELLLCHGALPSLLNQKGETPLRLAIDHRPSDYLQVIRQLARYGARPREEDRKVIDHKITQAIQIGAAMTPHYCSDDQMYFSLDQVEDLSLIAEVNPELLQDQKFQQLIPGTNFELLAAGIRAVRDRTIQIQKVIVGWPYYIDSSQQILCPGLEENEVTAASPPNVRKVYELALRDLRDNHGEEPKPIVSPPVLEIPRPEQWSAEPYYVPPVSTSTFPVPGTAITPTGAPPLPSL